MKIRCRTCGYSEKAGAKLFEKLISNKNTKNFWAMSVLLGPTILITLAIITGGLVFKNKIIQWITKQDYKCENPKCIKNKWDAITEKNDQKIKKYKQDEIELKKMIEVEEKQEKELVFKSKNEPITCGIIPNPLGFISNPLTMYPEISLAKKRKSISHKNEKCLNSIANRFKILYSALKFENKTLKIIAKLDEESRLKLECQFGNLQHNSDNTKFRDKVYGTDIREIGFNRSGRLYIIKEGSIYNIVCVGDKNTQNKDMKFLKGNYKS